MSLAQSITLILVALIAGAALLGVVLLHRRRRDKEPEDATEQVNSAPQNRGASHGGGGSHHTPSDIPVRSHYQALSMPGKVLVATVSGLLVFVLVMVVQYFRTGSPMDVWFIQHVYAVVAVTIGFGLGIVAQNAARRNEGILHVEYEDPEGGDPETDRTPVKVTGKTDSNGNQIVTEYQNRRAFGLFRKERLLAQDPELCESEKPPEKPIDHMIPDHAREIGPNRWFIRCTKRDPQKTPDTPADWEYSSPMDVPIEVHLRREQKLNQQETIIQSVRAQLRSAEDEVERLATVIESGKDDVKQEVFDEFRVFKDLLSSGRRQLAQAPSPGERSTHVHLGNGQNGAGAGRGRNGRPDGTGQHGPRPPQEGDA